MRNGEERERRIRSQREKSREARDDELAVSEQVRERDGGEVDPRPAEGEQHDSRRHEAHAVGRESHQKTAERDQSGGNASRELCADRIDRKTKNTVCDGGTVKRVVVNRVELFRLLITDVVYRSASRTQIVIKPFALHHDQQRSPVEEYATASGHRAKKRK